MAVSSPRLTTLDPAQDPVVGYRDTGMLVLRQAIPPSLLADLRRQAVPATALARHVDGPQAQRLPNVFAADGMPPARWRDFQELPLLREQVAAVLTPEHRPSPVMALLINPMIEPWMMPWHRDWLHNAERVDPDEWFATARDPVTFSQLNAALYDDNCLWWVPRSHDRRSSREEDAVRISAGPDRVDRRAFTELLDACRAMPGAVPVRLRAGDVALYRNSAWHAGLYHHDQPRATLHTWFDGVEDRLWQERRRASGLDAKNYDDPPQGRSRERHHG